MHTTWYVLEDGTPVNPDHCTVNASGRLVHKSGAFVAMRGNAPASRSMSAEELATLNREVKASPKAKTYETRDAKSE